MKNSILATFVFTATLLFAQTPTLNLVQLQTGFDSPVQVTHCGDDRLFIVEQDGRIRIMSKSGVINSTAFLNIDPRVNSSGNEQGLLGLAFSPNYKQDGFFYVNYTDTGTISSPSNSTVFTRISRFSVSTTDSNVADPNSEVILLQFPQPYSNHNGGNMMFGKDGYLYINTGDGGSGNDPLNSGQSLNTFLGKVLRIDVNGSAYAVPADNPFVGQANVKPEIWAYGLRNPWRASFDRLTADMWIGDVGQDAYEEIDFQPANSAGGENYGWKCREGFHPTPPPANTSGCPSSGFVDPVYEVPQGGGSSCSITGGYVYRGAQYNLLFGRYLFTDYCSGKFWAIRKLSNNTFAFDTLQTFTTFQYTSFGEDNLGELYVCYRGSTATNGRIYRITETSDCKPVAFISFNDSVSACAPVKISALKGEGLTYQWYNSSGLINGAQSNELAVQQSGWYKVFVAKTGQPGCEKMSDSVYVTVKDTTQLIPSKNILDFCKNQPAVDITGAVSPSGGIYSGALLSGDSIIPAITPAGSYTVSYTYTNSDGCVSGYSFGYSISDTTAITTNPPTAVLCNTSLIFDLSNVCSPVGGSYSGSFVSGTGFNLSSANIGSNAVQYAYTDSNGCISAVTFNINVQNCTGISESSTLDFMIYPNPSDGRVSIVMPESMKNAELVVTDMQGKQVLKLISTEYKNEIDLRLQPAGVYFVSITSQSERIVKRLVKE